MPTRKLEARIARLEARVPDPCPALQKLLPLLADDELIALAEAVHASGEVSEIAPGALAPLARLAEQNGIPDDVWQAELSRQL